MFCCVLVKSQLATVSRALAALTMASGIMLNTAPRPLSPSTSISDALWSTQERDGGLSMKMSLQLHKPISQTPSVSALPPLAHPPSPSPLLRNLRQSFEVQLHFLQLFHNACPFWICMNSLSRCFSCPHDLQWCVLYGILLYSDRIPRTIMACLFSGYVSATPLTRWTKMCCELISILSRRTMKSLLDVDDTASGTDWLMFFTQQYLMHCLQHRKKHLKV